MLYNWQPFFLLPFLSPSLLGNNQLVSAARLPFRTNPTARQELTSLETTVDVPGLSDLAAYVCPNVAMANSVKRQNPGATTVAVPKNELQALLLQLQQMELAILVLLQQIMGNGGLDPLSPSALPSGAMVGTAGGVAVSVFNSSPPPSPFPSPSPSSVNLASPTSIDFAALSSDAASTPPVLPTANAAGACTRTYGISTTTLRSTITVTASIVTVTAFGNDTGVAASSTPSLTHEATSRTTALEYAVATSTSGGVFLQLSRSGAAPTTLTGFSNDTSVAASRRTSLAQEATLTTTALDSGVAASTSGGIVIQLSGSGAAPTTSDPAPPKYSGGTAPASGQNSTGYRFNAQSSKNVAVYFGQTPATGGTTLAAQCADPSVDIVILAFVISSADGGQYPAVNFGAACGGQTTEMISKAPGLLSCPQLATNITTCQSKYGKKVMLSIGGATSQISFPTAASASTFATTMWNLFGPPGNVDMGLRPFGTVQIDGFDVGEEALFPPIHDTAEPELTRGRSRQRRQPRRKLGHIRLDATQPLRLQQRSKDILPLLRAAMPLPRRLEPTSAAPPLRLRLGAVLQQPGVPDRRWGRVHRFRQTMEFSVGVINTGCEATAVRRCAGLQRGGELGVPGDGRAGGYAGCCEHCGGDGIAEFWRCDVLGRS